MHIDYLIELVEEKPFLWDKNLRESYGIKTLYPIWAEVGEKMYKDWFDLSASEKSEKVKELRNKWRNIKDSYYRHLKKTSTYKKEYIYADSLKFLNPILQADYTSDTSYYRRISILPEENHIKTEIEDDNTYKEDADRSFLLSILPDYKKLDDDEKLNFKLLTLKFFKNSQKLKKAALQTQMSVNCSEDTKLIWHSPC